MEAGARARAGMGLAFVNRMEFGTKAEAEAGAWEGRGAGWLAIGLGLCFDEGIDRCDGCS